MSKSHKYFTGHLGGEDEEPLSFADWIRSAYERGPIRLKEGPPLSREFGEAICAVRL
jgi:hypothetical protein